MKYLYHIIKNKIENLFFFHPSAASPKSLLSPMGSKVKPMSTLVEEQHHRETKPLLRRNSDEVNINLSLVNGLYEKPDI
jgi:hypothetical protein